MRLVNVNCGYSLAGRRIIAIDHLNGFAAEIFSQDRPVARRQGRLVNVEFVGIHRALNDSLTKPVRGGNEHRVSETGLGIKSKHDAGGTNVATHHSLNTGRQSDLTVVKALVHPVGDSSIIEQRCEDLVHRGDDIVEATDVKERFLLSGKRCVRQVFRRR